MNMYIFEIWMENGRPVHLFSIYEMLILQLPPKTSKYYDLLLRRKVK